MATTATAVMASVPPPSPQEVTRKLSVHNKRTKKPSASGTESDSDVPSEAPPTPKSGTLKELGASPSGRAAGGWPLSSIAEPGEEDSEDEDVDEREEGEGVSPAQARQLATEKDAGEGVVRAGWLKKKGERRKTWKKRWFVLRGAHLAYYGTPAEYELIRIIDLKDVHAVSSVDRADGKRPNALAVVLQERTFFLEAKSAEDRAGWVGDLERARLAARDSISTPTGAEVENGLNSNAAGSGGASRPLQPLQIKTIPPPSEGLPIPMSSRASPPASPSRGTGATSSDSEGEGPLSASPGAARMPSTAGSVVLPAHGQPRDPSKVVVSGYLMKCSSKRKHWHKRWFVLTGERLFWARSHMDSKPHRTIALSQIVDALEYTLPSKSFHHLHSVSSPSSGHTISNQSSPPTTEDGGGSGFKIVTAKRALVLCAPSEEEEIRWLSSIRAMIARRTEFG